MKKSGAPLEVAQIAREVLKLGMRFGEISRRTGQNKETVRYRFNRAIIDRGFSLQAQPNHEALGLRRVIMKAWINQTHAPHIRDLLRLMNDLCYVVSFSRVLPEGFYEIGASVPRERVDDFIGFFDRLRIMGIFDDMEFYRFDWFRNVPMRTELYDFDRGVWDFDWNGSSPIGEEAQAIPSAGVASFDTTDLLILKELQRDATRSMTEIAQAIRKANDIDINYKTLEYHRSRHVIPRNLVSGYSLNWIGTRYNLSPDKAPQRQHRYVLLSVYVKGVSEAERLGLIGRMSVLPFLWCEAAGGDYFAQVAFPIELVNEGLEFFRGAVFERFGRRASCHTVDQTVAGTFPLSCNLWDDAEKRWMFEAHDLQARFENLTVMMKGQSPGSKSG